MRKLVKVIHKLYRGGEKGFTLIELLVVIGILAALAGVVTLSVTQFIGRGACEACKTEIHNCQTAVVAYRVDNPAYLATCGAYVGSTLLTELKYGDAWTVDASTGVVNPGTTCTAITNCD
jgi:prepilin-type N-terminal cleavage/methylation domain-containing protein